MNDSQHPNCGVDEASRCEVRKARGPVLAHPALAARRAHSFTVSKTAVERPELAPPDVRRVIRKLRKEHITRPELLKKVPVGLTENLWDEQSEKQGFANNDRRREKK